MTSVWHHDVRVANLYPFRLHVSSYEGKAIEQLIGSVTEPDPRLLDEVVVEATYAATDPPLLPRLRHLGIPYAVDTQTVRFANPGFLGKPTIAGLPYAPPASIRSGRAGDRFDEVIRGAMAFAASHDADAYLAPALPIYAATLPEVRQLQSSHQVAFDLMVSDVPSRPLYAYIAPSLSVLRSPFAVYERLLDRPFAGVYVQPLQFHPRQDNVERLVAYVAFLLEGKRYGFRMIGGRAGTFGLILMALGVDAVDSGLGERETYDLASLDRPPRPTADNARTGGRARFVYLGPLLTSVPHATAEFVVKHPALRGRFVCEQGECRYGGLEAQLDRPRAHFFHVRPAELDELRRRPSLEMRVQWVGQRLQSATELATVTNRVLNADGQATIPLDHLQRWTSVLIRMAAVEALRRDE